MDTLERLITVLKQALQKILLRTSKGVDNAKSEKTLYKLLSRNIFDSPENREEVEKALFTINKSFKSGVTDGPGVNDKRVLALDAVMQSKVKDFITEVRW